MNSPNRSLSPHFKHLNGKPKQSPIELKEKMRKNYKNKIQQCRTSLLDKLRGKLDEKELCGELTEIYTKEFNNPPSDSDEIELLEVIRKELIQEELEWWIKQYETFNADNVDWSAVEHEDNVICPICLKTNLTLKSDHINCSTCNISIQTKMSLLDVKKIILESLEKHNDACNEEAQFITIPNMDDLHIYLLCAGCKEMESVI